MTPVRLTTDTHVVELELDDSPAAAALVARLPLDLVLEDFHDTEKIAPLDRPLPTETAPAGFEPAVGDLTYYAPWGNLALFYRHFTWSAGLVPLGRVVTGDDLAGLEGTARLDLTV